MDIETATPETGPVNDDLDLDAIVADIEAQADAAETADEAGTDKPAADDPEAGDAVKAPALEGEDAPAKAKEPEGEEATPPATVKVKVNGEEREVSLDEALKGYSRTEDYKAKTEKLAEDRRTIETGYAEQLKTVASRFAQFDPVLAEAPAIDWAKLAQEDPAAYVAKTAALQQRQQYLATVTAEVNRVETEQRQATMQREYQALVSAMPQLADPEAAAKFDTDLRTGLKSGYGLDDATINSVADHRFYLLAADALKYRESEAAKAKATATLPTRKVTPVPTVKAVKPGAEAQRSTPRIRSNLSDSQFAEAMARRIASE